MTTIVVLFNLKEGVSPFDYENWARESDLPAVRSLKSIDAFRVLRTSGLLGSDAQPPYAYVEVIDVNDMNVFGAEVGADMMQKIAAQFQGFADNPLFILTNAVED